MAKDYTIRGSALKHVSNSYAFNRGAGDSHDSAMAKALASAARIDWAANAVMNYRKASPEQKRRFNQSITFADGQLMAAEKTAIDEWIDQS